MRQREERWRGVLLGRHGSEIAGAGTWQAREGHQRNSPENAPDPVHAGKQVQRWVASSFSDLAAKGNSRCVMMPDENIARCAAFLISLNFSLDRGVEWMDEKQRKRTKLSFVSLLYRQGNFKRCKIRSWILKNYSLYLGKYFYQKYLYFRHKTYCAPEIFRIK